MNPTVVVPRSALDLLQLREGVKLTSYMDSVGKLTGGVGHLLLPSECAVYPPGTHIPKNIVEEWFLNDAAKAYNAAKTQAQILRITDSNVIDVLTSVNYQLGTGWNHTFPKTWGHLVRGEYEEAAQELEHSKWFKQTPTRVHDFQIALRALIKSTV